jgi:hypothetical protein
MKAFSIILTAAALIAAGCASDPSKGTGPEVWYNPTHTSDTPANQVDRDMAECRILANSGPAGLAGWNAGSLLASAMADGGRRKALHQDCLIAKGYVRTRQSLVPAGLRFAKE